MNKEKRETYKFTRIRKNKNVYLISTRQRRYIDAHGTHFHQQNGGITEYWWYLLPGAYFLYEFSKKHKGYYIHKLIIKENDGSQKNWGKFYEEHQPVRNIPDWLHTHIQTLPEYEEKHINGKYIIYRQ